MTPPKITKESKDESIRINLMIPLDIREKWDAFIEKGEINTISKLVRESVDFYMNSKEREKDLEGFSTYSHDLKNELNAIKGFSQILIEEYKDELSWDVLLKIKEIYDKSVNIEKILNKISGEERFEKEQYDVLIVDDDDSTIHLLTDFFKKKGVTTRFTTSARDAFGILNYSTPKLILLDILLPDENGYEVCKKIKSKENLKDVPIYFITAVPETEVYEKIKDIGADGYFIKPFNMTEFNKLITKLEAKS